MSTNEYIWNWFQYHAEQRLVAFRFYLVFLGLLAVGFTSGSKGLDADLIRLLGGFGAFISLAFLALEIRNERLMSIGRNALEKMELDEDSNMPHEFRVCHLSKNRNIFESHKFWLRAIYALCTFVFFIGFACPLCLL